jgi:hypothetical protein
LELLGEGLPDDALGAVGEAGGVGEGNGHSQRLPRPTVKWRSIMSVALVIVKATRKGESNE